MTPPSIPDHGISLIAIEMGLTTVALALAFCWPRCGSALFSRIEQALTKLARRRAMSVAAVGATALFLRLAILPLCPVPHPFSPNDFSFLLASNTFALGKLTNPTPAMWQHFETIHVTMKPTYMSMYFPGPALVMAAGKVLTGQAWCGILFSAALMCAAICWMLQAWLPPTWALLGGMLAVLRLGLFSYWINSYSGGGAVAALGGALVLGAFPRWIKRSLSRDSMLLAIGLILLLTSRPYEGFLLFLPVAAILLHWLHSGTSKPANIILLRRSAAPLALVILSIGAMGYYDYEAFGNVLTLPYTINRATYATAPYFVWQSPRTEPLYGNVVMRNFYHNNELTEFQSIHSLSGFLPRTVVKVVRAILFFSGIALLPAMPMLFYAVWDRRIRFLIYCVCMLVVGMAIQIYLLPHYIAPFTAAFYAIGLQCMRHLRVWAPGGQPIGREVVRLMTVTCVVMAVIRLDAKQLHLRLLEWPSSEWIDQWSGPGHFGTDRARIQSDFERLPGKQLVMVRYSPAHQDLDEWVYNAPDISKAKVIWARELQPASDMQFIHYYKERQVWLVQPDSNPVTVSPYQLDLSKSSVASHN